VQGVQSNCVQDTASGRVACPSSFPNSVNFGQTWNASLARELGAIIGIETRALWLAGAHEYNTETIHIGLGACRAEQEGGMHWAGC
jgi:beta-glucosidase-like glycosyl hydrolase